jgi:hypothetical protein
MVEGVLCFNLLWNLLGLLVLVGSPVWEGFGKESRLEVVRPYRSRPPAYIVLILGADVIPVVSWKHILVSWIILYLHICTIRYLVLMLVRA